MPATGHNAMNAAMADGTVRPLAAGMDWRIWWAIVTPQDGIGRSKQRAVRCGQAAEG